LPGWDCSSGNATLFFGNGKRCGGTGNEKSADGSLDFGIVDGMRAGECRVLEVVVLGNEKFEIRKIMKSIGFWNAGSEVVVVMEYREIWIGDGEGGPCHPIGGE
jgi:hypothetical protein